MADFASQAGHFYLPDGTPFYTVVGANGKERDATLRDARKVGAFPSYTTVARCAAAPQLEKWKRTQLALAILTLPQIDGETNEEFLARVEQDWQKEGRDAADRGTLIHGAIERHHRHEGTDLQFFHWVIAANDQLAILCGFQKWQPERSFACADGYGGKVDLHSDEWLIDIKTKELDEAMPTLYDEHFMQLAAYRRGLGKPKLNCAILFVDRREPRAMIRQADEPDLKRGEEMFLALLAYYQAKTNYRPHLVKT